MTSATHAKQDPLLTQLGQIGDNLREGRAREAKSLALQFVEKTPENVDGWILLGRAHLNLMEYAQALDAAEKAVALEPNHPAAQLLRTEGLLRCGRNDEAFAAAKKLESERKYDPVVILEVGFSYTRTNRHADAARCYERVRVLRPAHRSVVHNLAGSYIALGEMEKAEALYDDVLRKDGHEFDAYYNRATLRKQTPERNHVAEMEKVLASLPPGDGAEHVLCYSLAKELEDLKEWKRAFAYLKRGAEARKRILLYQPAIDTDVMDEVGRQFDGSFFARSHTGYADESPIFVIGMPRSGTTLVDRILSSHSTVRSVGESDEFAQTIARRMRIEKARAEPEIQLIKELDFEAVGRDYCRSINGLLPGYRHLLDKTPKNFINVGLILTALPNAKIIHIRRHPVDSCYAVYKTLFRQGYPFSYDLEDTGRFYLGYMRLMDHWRKVLPGHFLDVDYEELVERQEDITRRMIAFCDLEWEDTCLSFEKNSTPLLTASASQVRQPIYKSSVALWRHYEEELQPLIRVLKEGSIEVG
jgi:tetratricopeptide (TPR) repeat protein